MIDEFFQRAAPKAARATANATRNAVAGAGNAALHASESFFDWFQDFRWIEFTAACTGAMAAGVTMATSMGLPDAIARKVGIFGAVVTALAFIRSPKTKWEPKNDADIDDEE